MKKLYLFGLALSVAAGAAAQQQVIKKGDALLPPEQVMSDEAERATEQGQLNARVWEARKYQTNLDHSKAPGDIIFEEDFDGGFNGWSNDNANKPANVDPAWEFVWGTDFTRGNLMTFAQLNSPTAANGAAFFNANYIREQNPQISVIQDPAWAALKSPVYDLSNISATDLPNVVLSFYNVYRHCCHSALNIVVDVSFDGGNTFPAQNRTQIRTLPGATGTARNTATPADNRSYFDIGRKLLVGAADLSQVVIRFTWDSSVPDGNNQTSTEYYWAIDDIALYVAPEVDTKMTAGYYGDTFYEFDYRQIPEDFAKDYPLSAAVVNHGSSNAQIRVVAELRDTLGGAPKIYKSEVFGVPFFTDTTVVFPVFTDWDGQEDLKTQWNIRYWTELVSGTDFEINEKDTVANVLPLHITEDTWAHNRPWAGGFLQSQEKFDDGTFPATPYLQRYLVPENLQSVTISNINVSFYDDTEDVLLTLPNQIEFVLDSGAQSQAAWSNASPTWFYYNDIVGETDGLIFLNEQNRADRITQETDTEADIISGEVTNAITGLTGPVTLRRGVNYWIKFTPQETINMAAGGVERDNATLFFGPFSQAGSNWFSLGTSGQAPIINFTVTDVQVGIDEKNANKPSFEVLQNRPNPFSGVTTIEYSMTKPGNASLEVLNVAGKKVFSVAPEFQNAGTHKFEVAANNLSNGIYFYTLTVDGKSITKKMVVNK